MRKTKTFQIDGIDFQFEVRELTVREIISLLQEDVFENVDLTDLTKFRKLFSEKLLPLCTNAKLNQLVSMTPGEIKELWDRFVEVNSVFFDMARKAGLTDAIANLKQSVIADFSRLLANL